MTRTGIFGGSFNPIHTGHIAIAQTALRQCNLDEVWLMVSPQNPLKQGLQLLDDDVRLMLAQQALEGIQGVRACDYEFQLPKPSFTWNTLRHLSKDFPERHFTLLIGGDNWAHFERWRNWKDILRHYEVAVYPREDYPGNISMPLINVSSTEIRQRIKNCKSIEGLVPDKIIKLVERYYR